MKKVLSLTFGALLLVALQPVLAHEHSETGTTIDTDGDGYVDCVEKGHYHDDMDNDGIDDEEDDTMNDLVSTNDRDADGIPDYIEKSEYRHNHDNTGKHDAEDLDDDDDGIGDRTETVQHRHNHDNAGKGDKRDLDDDNDGIADLDEATCGKIFDEDNDGVIDRNDDSDDSDSDETDGEDTDEAVAETYAVAIEDFAFTPDALTVHVGDSVTFTNNDSMLHTASSADGTTFNSGDLSHGESYTHTFTEAGTFSYYCAYHRSFMTGTITVEE